MATCRNARDRRDRRGKRCGRPIRESVVWNGHHCSKQQNQVDLIKEGYGLKWVNYE